MRRTHAFVVASFATTACLDLSGLAGETALLPGTGPGGGDGGAAVVDGGAPETDGDASPSGRIPRLYVIGGYIEPASKACLASVFSAVVSADGSIGAFREEKAMPAERCPAGAFATADGFAVVGGETPATPLDTNLVARVGADGEIAEWRTAGFVPTPRRNASVAVGAGRVYLIGGTDTAGTVLDRIDHTSTSPPSFSDWGTAKLSAPRSEVAAVTTTGDLYSLGGATSAVVDSSEALIAPRNADGSLGPFRTDAVAMSVARGAAAAFTFGTSLVVTGGRTVDAAGVTDSVDVFAIAPNGDLGTRRSGPKMPKPVSAHALATYGRWAYVVGGQRTAVASDVFVANLADDGMVTAWRTTAPLPVGLARAASSGASVISTRARTCSRAGSSSTSSSAATAMHRRRRARRARRSTTDGAAHVPSPRRR